MSDEKCTCGNPENGFDCVCSWIKTHPGDQEYSCEYCGIYNASEPRCSKCEEDKSKVNKPNCVSDIASNFIVNELRSLADAIEAKKCAVDFEYKVTDQIVKFNITWNKSKAEFKINDVGCDI